MIELGQLEETRRGSAAASFELRNQIGTNEFVKFCHKINAEPYLVVNCGDGDMREARDWVEYCNGTQPTHYVKLRQQHGPTHEEPDTPDGRDS